MKSSFSLKQQQMEKNLNDEWYQDNIITSWFGWGTFESSARTGASRWW